MEDHGCIPFNGWLIRTLARSVRGRTACNFDKFSLDIKCKFDSVHFIALSRTKMILGYYLKDLNFAPHLHR